MAAAQLLWNTYYHWRTMLDCCREGYSEMGMEREAASISEYEEMFSKYAHRCKQFILRRTLEGQGDFVGFMEEIGERMSSDTNKLFYSHSGLRQRKAAYVEGHREYFLELMRATGPR